MHSKSKKEKMSQELRKGQRNTKMLQLLNFLDTLNLGAPELYLNESNWHTHIREEVKHGLEVVGRYDSNNPLLFVCRNCGCTSALGFLV